MSAITPQPDLRDLYAVILSLETQDEAGLFFRDLLTESELAEFANRWKAARLLSDKVPYSAIVRETGLSSTTVARISKWLNGPGGGYRRAIAKLVHHHAVPSGGTV